MAPFLLISCAMHSDDDSSSASHTGVRSWLQGPRPMHLVAKISLCSHLPMKSLTKTNIRHRRFACRGFSARCPRQPPHPPASLCVSQCLTKASCASLCITGSPALKVVRRGNSRREQKCPRRPPHPPIPCLHFSLCAQLYLYMPLSVSPHLPVPPFPLYITVSTFPHLPEVPMCRSA